MSRVLYITYDGLTDPLGQSQIIPYLLELSQHGHTIHIVSAEKAKRLKEGHRQVKNKLSSAGIGWHIVPYLSKPRGLAPVITYWRLLAKARSVAATHSLHVAHCRSYIPALIGEHLQKKQGLKFLFDMRGFWADERVEAGLWNSNNLLFRGAYRFFKNKERQWLCQADAIVVLTQAGAQEIKRWHLPGFQDHKLFVIPCCVDTRRFQMADQNKRQQLRAQLGIGAQHLVLVYAGSLGTWYLLPEMLRFYQRLLKQYANAYFLFLTNENPEQLLAVARTYQLPEKQILIRSVPYDDVPRYMAVGDVAIFLIKNLYSKKASSPTKMAEFMSVGLPMICNPIGDVTEIVRHTRCGLLLTDFDEATMDRIVGQLHTLLPADVHALHAAACLNFDLLKAAAQYDHIYRLLS